MTDSLFRFGTAAKLYYDAAGQKMPRQLDLLEEWFPSFIVRTVETDGSVKKEAYYEDREFLIHAVRYREHLYSGTSDRISQITGRLTGTAKGNQEKERKTAELIRRHLAEVFVSDPEAVSILQDTVRKMFPAEEEELMNRLWETLFDRTIEEAERREVQDPYEKISEPAAFDDEVFDGLVYNIIYQLHLQSWEGLVNAYLWLMTGSLLRNECGRLLRMFDSSFHPVAAQYSRMIPLRQKLHYMLFPEEYEPVYSGDDEESRFPDVTWYCDHCGEELNIQEGFDDHLPYWQCRRCGYLNFLDADEIYDNSEDYENDIRTQDPEQIEEAIRKRKKELEAG